LWVLLETYLEDGEQNKPYVWNENTSYLWLLQSIPCKSTVI